LREGNLNCIQKGAPPFITKHLKKGFKLIPSPGINLQPIESARSSLRENFMDAYWLESDSLRKQFLKFKIEINSTLIKSIKRTSVGL